MKLSRIAALVAVAGIASACTGGGGATTAPTQGPATQSPTQAATGAPSGTPEATIAAPANLVTAGKLTDCVDIEYPPMEFFPSADVTDPNAATGFDVDFARAVAARLGLTLEIRNTGFDQLIPDLQAKRCDIVWSALYVSDDRLKVADAVPYMTTGHVIMVPAGNPKAIKSPDDLCGKTISIQSGGLVEKRANEQSGKCTAAGKPAITIQGYKQVADELAAIVNAKVDAIWETDSAVQNWMIKYPNTYEVGYAFPPDNTYGVYYLKGNTDLGTALKATMLALKADKSLLTLTQKYAMDESILEPLK